MSASEMPVLPLVGSRSSRPDWSSPAASAASIIAFATRSLMEPVGFWPSSFAKMRAPPRGDMRFSSTSGVFPTRSRRLAAVVLRMSLPNVDGRTELPEHLVDAPEQTAARRRGGRLPMAIDEIASAETRDLEQVFCRIPLPVLDHSLPPLRPEPVDGVQDESGLARRSLDQLGVEASEGRGI